MNAVAEAKPMQVAEVAPNETTAIIQMIERAALNPAVDIDKMERLLQMQERVMERNARSAYALALSEMQPELPIIAERGAILNRANEVQSTYARWEDINEAIKPVLAKHGFALSFRTGTDDGGRVLVTGVLSHREGHSVETTMPFPVDASGGKNGIQGVASSISYGQRYTARALLNLTSRGGDDDGQAAGAPTVITEDDVGDLQALIDDVGANRVAFLKHFGIASLADMPRARHQEAVRMLEAKRSRR